MKGALLHGRFALPWMALLALPLLSCFEPESVVCPSGRVCGPGLSCAAFQDSCIATPCGDGAIQEGEVCDDGNVLDGDGCSHDCKSNEVCGNGQIDAKAGEVCDDGNEKAGDGCSEDCRSAERCGDGIIDTSVGEVCDDKNTRAGDGCSATCHSTERCGNGIVDAPVGEVCDDGDQEDGDGCSSDCRSGEGCGNGVRDLDEECDDGNDDNTDNCLNTCVRATCGDGFTDGELPRTEECDTAGESADCNSNCAIRECGDGVVNRSAGEECDTPGAVSTSGCDADCSRPSCGDGFVNEAAEELCDDGNGNNEDDCLNTCVPNSCGDGKVDRQGPEIENCDDGNRETENECPYGTQTCMVCRSDCMEQLQRTGPYCGDGEVNPGEACDDRNAHACGTCSADCTRHQRAKATGSIEAVGGDKLSRPLLPADRFSLGNGISVPLIFEFHRGGPVGPGNIPIGIAQSDTGHQVAEKIKDAIEGVRASLQISASVQGSTVSLENQSIGSFGNQPINEQVRERAFKVTGLSGGEGADCPQGTSCSSDEDCAPGLACLSGSVCSEPQQ